MQPSRGMNAAFERWLATALMPPSRGGWRRVAALGLASTGWAEAFTPEVSSIFRRPAASTCLRTGDRACAQRGGDGHCRRHGTLLLHMQEQDALPPTRLDLVSGPGLGASPRGSRTLERTAQWFESSTLMGELTTDDGIPVSDLSLSQRRSDWIAELLTLFNSKVLSRIVNRMAFTIAWAIAVTTVITIGDRYPESALGIFTDFEIPGWPHEIVGGFLAILLVFRTDQAYDRFWEGRRQWAELSTACRDIGRISMSNLQEPMVETLMAHVAAFPVALKQHLRGLSQQLCV